MQSGDEAVTICLLASVVATVAVATSGGGRDAGSLVLVASEASEAIAIAATAVTSRSLGWRWR